GDWKGAGGRGDGVVACGVPAEEERGRRGRADAAGAFSHLGGRAVFDPGGRRRQRRQHSQHLFLLCFSFLLLLLFLFRVGWRRGGRQSRRRRRVRHHPRGVAPAP
ncbi:unnamed protein product, partial [Scytosiphon promiscuus]